MKPLRVDLTGASRRLPTALLVGATSLTVLALPTSATAAHPTPVTVAGANSYLTFISAPLNGDFSLAA